MTKLEQLIADHVATSMSLTLRRITEQIAEEMAQEILQDPQFRDEMRAMIRRAFGNTVADLTIDNPSA